jgi:inner membrane protein
VPLAMVAAAGTGRVTRRLLCVAALFSILPDADVIGFDLGVPYDHMLGHRGFFHSPCFALVAALVGAAACRSLGTTYLGASTVLFIAMALHGVLDAATDGGRGIAFLSPFSNHRYFFPWQPIAVSPLGLRRFIGPRGLAVLESELVWVWAPLLTMGLIGFLLRHRFAYRGRK